MAEFFARLWPRGRSSAVAFCLGGLAPRARRHAIVTTLAALSRCRHRSWELPANSPSNLPMSDTPLVEPQLGGGRVERHIARCACAVDREARTWQRLE